MLTKPKIAFKAVDYMTQVRAELSNLYQTDKSRFHRELNQAMTDFLANRTKKNIQKKVVE